MNKKIISLLMAAGMTMSAVPAMATTEGIIQGDIMMLSDSVEVATDFAYTGAVKAIKDGRITITVEDMDVTFVLGEGVKADEIAEGDIVTVTSASPLETKDIKEATAVIKAAKTDVIRNKSYNNYEAVVNSVDGNRVTVTVDGDMVVTFVTTDKTALYTIAGEKAEAVKKGDKVIVVSASPLETKDIKGAEAIVITNGDDKATVFVDEFRKSEEQLISADGSLVLNMEDAAKYANKKLLVFYDFTTMSIPAQTSPIKVVALDDCGVGISFKVGDSVLTINGTKVEVETPFVVGSGVTLVPLRVISEAFGAQVEWDGETKTVTITNGDKNISVSINSKKAVVNGEEKELEEAPELKSDVTMIPLRFISENLGAVVGYDAETAQITVSR